MPAYRLDRSEVGAKIRTKSADWVPWPEHGRTVKVRARLGKAYGEPLEEVAQALAQVPQGFTSGEEGKSHQGPKELSLDEFHLALPVVLFAPIIMVSQH
jgi:hypothetical protein